MSDGLQYFFLALLFISIILFVIGVWMFSKWLTVGPKLNQKWNTLVDKVTGKKSDLPVQRTKDGQVIINEEYQLKVEDDIKNAKTPQELLDAQNRKEALEKEMKALQRKIEEENNAKLAKLKEKEEAKKYTAEVKAEAKRIAEENKAKKKEGK